MAQVESTSKGLQARLIKNLDWRIPAATLLLALIGLATLYSVEYTRDMGDFWRQVVFVSLGLLVMAACVYLDCDFMPNAYPIIFWGNLFLLSIPIIIGLITHHTIRGTYNWIPLGVINIQPSELSKLAVIATLAVFMSEHDDRVGDPVVLLKSFFYVVAPPMALIVLANDMGTAVVLLAIWTAVVFVAGAQARHLAWFYACWAILFGALWKLGLLRAHLVDRILGWLHPAELMGDEGYQYVQTYTAVGSGQLTGAGWRAGPMTHQEGVIPELHTDMIYSALAEEWGFVGCVVVLALYGFIVWRGISTIYQAKNELERYLAAGVTGCLAFHVIVNVGMHVGLFPIIGISLPFMSYGGSNMLAMMAAVGLLINVHMRRKRIAF